MIVQSHQRLWQKGKIGELSRSSGNRRRYNKEFKIDAVELMMRRFKSSKQAHRFLSVHTNIENLFRIRHLCQTAYDYLTTLFKALPEYSYIPSSSSNPIFYDILPSFFMITLQYLFYATSCISFQSSVGCVVVPMSATKTAAPDPLPSAS